jgi:ketosteroid isomerase-like protein
MQDVIRKFIDATNSFDVEKALSLFASDAIIDDVSVGDKFEGTAGVRKYIEQYFVGYKTVSKVLSVEALSEYRALVRLDFTGDFGHETGTLDMSTNADGSIAAVSADLD